MPTAYSSNETPTLLHHRHPDLATNSGGLPVGVGDAGERRPESSPAKVRPLSIRPVERLG